MLRDFEIDVRPIAGRYIRSAVPHMRQPNSTYSCQKVHVSINQLKSLQSTQVKQSWHLVGLLGSQPHSRLKSIHTAITVTDDHEFHLSNSQISYIFRADKSGELCHLYFGRRVESPSPLPEKDYRGWIGPLGRMAREFPDVGHGDFRMPAVRLRHGGSAITKFKYTGHEVIPGKTKLSGLPSTFGSADDATTVIVHLRDETIDIDAYLSYTIFTSASAIARSVKFENRGNVADAVIEQASISIDMPSREWEMIQLSGDWSREASHIRSKVHIGVQGIHSLTGYSSHVHNPFLGLVTPTTTEKSGDGYGFNMIYTGSYSGHIEKSSQGSTRVMIGLNPLHFSWPLELGTSFTTPEVVAVYSSTGLGGMSRTFHRLYRNHLMQSQFTLETRPTLLNNWEATYFDFDADTLYQIAKEASELGVKLFVLDDGWFGDKRPRVNAKAGLGDWVVNPKRFPHGLDDLVDKVNALGSGMKFGLWVEPEMVQQASELYEAHPDWVLYSSGYDRSEQRNQLVLDLSLREVQDHIIDAMTKLLRSANIGYVKWDNNRGMHEMPLPSTAHRYMLGLYRILETLTSRFPTVLWEGCASGGGRFDAGLLHYWPQIWASDNTDGLDRLFIQFGTSLVYPASSMGGHISAVPCHQTERTTPLVFRAHVAMMCGGFGFELDPRAFTAEEKKIIPGLIELSEKINPLVIRGDLYRLSRPDEGNWPAALFLSEDGHSGVLLAFQMQNKMHQIAPALLLEGLKSGDKYVVEGSGLGGTKNDTVELDGETLMNQGLTLKWVGDYQSKIIWIRAST